MRSQDRCTSVRCRGPSVGLVGSLRDYKQLPMLHVCSTCPAFLAWHLLTAGRSVGRRSGAEARGGGVRDEAGRHAEAGPAVADHSGSCRAASRSRRSLCHAQQPHHAQRRGAPRHVLGRLPRAGTGSCRAAALRVAGRLPDALAGCSCWQVISGLQEQYGAPARHKVKKHGMPQPTGSWKHASMTSRLSKLYF